MNIVEIAGHLGADPETRFTGDGQKVTTIRMAVNSKRAGKEETMWWRITIWGDRFDKLMPYLKKGSGIIVVGEMRKPEIYNGKDGQPQVSLELTAEIIRFSPFGKTNKEGQGQGQGQQQRQGKQGGFGEQTFSDDEGSFGSSSGRAEMEVEEESVPF